MHIRHLYLTCILDHLYLTSMLTSLENSRNYREFSRANFQDMCCPYVNWQSAQTLCFTVANVRQYYNED